MTSPPGATHAAAGIPQAAIDAAAEAIHAREHPEPGCESAPLDRHLRAAEAALEAAAPHLRADEPDHRAVTAAVFAKFGPKPWAYVPNVRVPRIVRDVLEAVAIVRDLDPAAPGRCPGGATVAPERARSHAEPLTAQDVAPGTG
jgi:hypothetical protein